MPTGWGPRRPRAEREGTGHPVEAPRTGEERTLYPRRAQPSAGGPHPDSPHGPWVLGAALLPAQQPGFLASARASLSRRCGRGPFTKGEVT